MTDADVVYRVADLLGTSVAHQRYKRQPHYKDKYVMNLNGHRALFLMRAIRPWMGERRSQRIGEILEAFPDGV